MNEKLIRDYWADTGSNIYPDFQVEIQTVAGGVVIFRECEPYPFGDFEHHTICILDVLAWVYSKVDGHHTNQQGRTMKNDVDECECEGLGSECSTCEIEL